MWRKKDSFQYYIGFGLVLNAFSYFLYKSGLIIDSVKLGLLILGIVLELIGFVQYRRGRIRKE